MLHKSLRLRSDQVLFVALLVTFALGVTALALDAGKALAALRVTTIRYVAKTGSDASNCTVSGSPCSTVQHAVDVSSPNDEIRVAKGTYSDIHAEPKMDLSATGSVTQVVYITQSLYLRGGFTVADNFTTQNIAGNVTILDASNNGRVIYISGNVSTTIEGFTLRKGDAFNLGGDPNSGVDAGAGVYAITATLTLTGNQIINNGLSDQPANGGGIFSMKGPTTLIGNNVSNNSSASDGAGLYLFDAYGTVISNVFSYNSSTSGSGGGATFNSRQYVTINNNQFLSNTAASGGGVNLSGSVYTTMDANIVRYNTTTFDAALVIDTDNETLTNNVIEDNTNTFSNYSSGLAIYHGNVTLIHTTIARNNGGDGSGIEVFGTLGSPSLVTMTNSIIDNHTIGITVSNQSTITLNGVLWHNNGTNYAGPGTVTPSNQYTGNPHFAADGYHLTAISNAIHKGVATNVTTDIDGQLRFYTLAPDLGADEYASPYRLFLPIIIK